MECVSWCVRPQPFVCICAPLSPPRLPLAQVGFFAGDVAGLRAVARVGMLDWAEPGADRSPGAERGVIVLGVPSGAYLEQFEPLALARDLLTGVSGRGQAVAWILGRVDGHKDSAVLFAAPPTRSRASA